MPTQEIELTTILPWKIERQMETRYGSRILRTAKITPEFKELWTLNTHELKQLGITVHGFVAEWWCSPDDFPVEQYSLTATLANPEPLYNWQVNHARTLKQATETNNVAFDGSSTGTGKTVCNMVAQCRERGLRPLIICKKSGIAVWADWCERLNVGYFDIMNYDRVRLGQCEFVKQVRTPRTANRVAEMRPDDHLFEYKRLVPAFNLDVDNASFKAWFEQKKEKINNRPTPKDVDFRFEFPPGSKPVIVIDEVHKAANHGTVNSRILLAAKKSKVPLAMLSATASDSPLKMDALGFALGLHKHVDFRQWCLKNGCEFDRESRQWIFTGGPAALAKIQSNIFPRRGSRMRKEDIVGFPKVQITAESIYLGEAVKAMLRAYEGNDEHLSELIQKAKDAGANNLDAVVRIYLLQMSETLKIPFLVEEARDLMNEGFSVVVAVNFNKTRERLMKELETPCAIYGDQTAPAREAAIRAFQANTSRIIILNTKAGSDSISLNDIDGRFPRVGLICPTDSAIDLIQLFGRLNRATDKSMAQYRLIFASGTPEDRMCRNVQHKINNIALLNDADLRSGIELFK